ncbi:hypothetical protein MWU75_09625 [Ornithinimicrobium sp. F0845]|uniref:CG0192-related protein n=1 Tax=Ornithinimicrobium sp. F0845 TaxID=2926412 RepID=UPI001FF58A89|nr:hypothetical protein [Ornithinimicrobium sp. F0845]MCK0112395.1 hypothetical protein [Ornithinimicrobium sp. F0845]
MAIIHRATLTPTKLELIGPWLDQQQWGGSGDLELVGSYRFDDPAGEVGVEALLVRRGSSSTVLHVPLTYRAAPLEGAQEHLVGTTQHSVLGQRWVYAASGDPVALGCYARALAGQQDQASFEVYDGDTLVTVRDQTVRLTLEPGPATETDPRLAQVVDDVEGTHRLVANWEGGSGAVAAGSAAYVHVSAPLGLTMDTANTADVLESLDDEDDG